MDNRVRLLVERIEACAGWEHLLTAEDHAAAVLRGAGARRREFMAWRALVRRERGAVGIGYAPTGAPQLAGGSLSVSHSRDYVVVCLGDGPCGVDVERLDRNFSRCLSRYATAAERTLSDDPLLPAALWCAKEALYKYAGRTGLNLRRDLRIERIDFARGCMTGRICGGEPLTIRFRAFDGHMLAWVG